MKKLPFLLIILFSVSTIENHTAKAKDFPFQGTQIQTALFADMPLVPKKLKLVVSGTYFTNPEKDVHFFFGYGGVQWQVCKWFWIAPKVGVAANWAGQFPLIVSLWMGAAMFDGLLSAFVESEVYLNQDVRDYYGFYSLDVHPRKWFSVGIQAEQVNAGVMFGPHVEFNYKIFTFGFHYYFGAQEENRGHGPRIFLKLHFSSG